MAKKNNSKNEYLNTEKDATVNEYSNLSKKEIKKLMKENKKNNKLKAKKEKLKVEGNGKDNSNSINSEDVCIDSLDNKEKSIDNNPIEFGNRKLKDLLAPSGFDRSNEDYLGVGSKNVRSFVVNGYPSIVNVGWLDALYNADSDLDVSYHIQPADERSALDEINKQIAKEEAQFLHEQKSGNIKNLGVLEHKIQELYTQRTKLERNIEKLYHSCIVANLHCKSPEELEKETNRLTHTLAARKVDIMSMYLRQDEGYKSGLPFGVNYLERFRTINTGGIVASFCLYNSELSHPGGTFLGLNLASGTPMYINRFDRSILANGNMVVFGSSGSGKSFLLSLLTLRSSIQGIHTCILDPEGEYSKLCSALGGAYLVLAPDSDTTLNPFQISEEYSPKKRKSIVNVKSKISDLIDLIGVMVGGMTSEQVSIVSSILRELYEVDFGINQDPRSLFTNEESYDKVTGKFTHSGRRKLMPTISDFYNKLKAYVEKNPKAELEFLVNSLVIFTKGNAYDLFDGQTSKQLENLDNSPLITFDVSALEDNGHLKAVCMSVALSWMWEGWIKKDRQGKKKTIITDETWQMLDTNIPGSEYTGRFLNRMARRCRKRTASLVCASQSFHEFVQNPQGLAVLGNSSIKMLLKTESIALQSIQDTFMLSNGERDFLMSAKRGEALIKMENESCTCLVVPFDFEKEIIENPFAETDPVGREDYYDYDEDDDDF